MTAQHSTEVQPGEVIVISAGEFSDRSIWAVVRVLAPFNAAREGRKVRACNGGKWPGVSAFVAWLAHNNLAEELPFRPLETYDGDWETFDIID